MPRKFLGQKIERDIDCLRPSSVTLTADDLRSIPPFPADPDEEGENRPTGKISRKFGGTIRLKKRLQSVPELFLHDLKKKPTRSRTEQRTTSKGIKPSRDFLPTVKEDDSRFTVGALDKVFVSEPIVMPVMVGSDRHPLTQHANKSASGSELLFDEIISAYCGGCRVPKLLDTEIDRVLAHLSHNQVGKKRAGTALPKIYDAESLQPISRVPDPESPVMVEKISSPEYTGSSSDHWSSGDEFSEISGLDGDNYVTAINSLRSTNCSSSSVDALSTKHQIQPVKLWRSRITPGKLFLQDNKSLLSEAMHDDQDIQDPRISGPSAMQLLCDKIESVDIASSSSSLYSEHRT
ncbi:hypothetical protein HG536_0A08140 [Torulaspora globosa]|uniref:Uncharacterized protein n=1 Tax=Torulaspora globosa TaxID=48254 RepID=A0A7G3ZBW3_9SACH|nr:uncharacterized protein HG536_0A08140 [Torulaspora globosa]QLL30999.1 hypothetical protein HG536_0A08140 [Torulaspora globosa]